MALPYLALLERSNISLKLNGKFVFGDVVASVYCTCSLHCRGTPFICISTFSIFGLNNTMCSVISYASCSYYIHAVKPMNRTKTLIVVVVVATVAWYVDDAAT